MKKLSSFLQFLLQLLHPIFPEWPLHSKDRSLLTFSDNKVSKVEGSIIHRREMS
jgi:hypothetical protein